MWISGNNNRNEAPLVTTNSPHLLMLLHKAVSDPQAYKSLNNCRRKTIWGSWPRSRKNKRPERRRRKWMRSRRSIRKLAGKELVARVLGAGLSVLRQSVKALPPHKFPIWEFQHNHRALSQLPSFQTPESSPLKAFDSWTTRIASIPSLRFLNHQGYSLDHCKPTDRGAKIDSIWPQDARETISSISTNLLSMISDW